MAFASACASYPQFRLSHASNNPNSIRSSEPSPLVESAVACHGEPEGNLAQPDPNGLPMMAARVVRVDRDFAEAREVTIRQQSGLKISRQNAMIWDSLFSQFRFQRHPCDVTC